jgi:hypothetical protein
LRLGRRAVSFVPSTGDAMSRLDFVSHLLDVRADHPYWDLAREISTKVSLTCDEVMGIILSMERETAFACTHSTHDAVSMVPALFVDVVLKRVGVEGLTELLQWRHPHVREAAMLAIASVPTVIELLTADCT